MIDTDKKQTWRSVEKRPAGNDYGAVDLVTIEVLDFDAGTYIATTTGTCEGEHVSREHAVSLDLGSVTPASAAEYRRRMGYARIS